MEGRAPSRPFGHDGAWPSIFKLHPATQEPSSCDLIAGSNKTKGWILRSSRRMTRLLHRCSANKSNKVQREPNSIFMLRGALKGHGDFI